MAHPKYWYLIAQTSQLFACDFNNSWQTRKIPVLHHPTTVILEQLALIYRGDEALKEVARWPL